MNDMKSILFNTLRQLCEFPKFDGIIILSPKVFDYFQKSIFPNHVGYNEEIRLLVDFPDKQDSLATQYKECIIVRGS